jgi:hypothetical protein
MEHRQKQSQGMTFAAVGAHHTNGLAERRIKEVQSMTRASLIFANHRWKDTVTVNWWPYAMRMANESINASINEGQSQKVPGPDFLKHDGFTEPKALQTVWMPSVRSRPRSSSRTTLSQVGRTSKSWYIPWALTTPPTKCGTRIELSRICHSEGEYR